MKKFWLPLAVGAVAALAVQVGSVQLADPDPNTAPPRPMFSPTTAEIIIVDPWINITVAVG